MSLHLHRSKIAAGAAALVLMLQAANADAVVSEHRFSANAVNFCQAFTPGPSNTLRARVVGLENVGTVPIAVACSMLTLSNGALLVENPRRLVASFSNRTATPVTVGCTLLTGYDGEPGAYAVNKSITVPASSRSFVEWTQADNPTAGALSLGNNQVGINCTLPPNVIMTDMHLYWFMDIGVII